MRLASAVRLAALLSILGATAGPLCQAGVTSLLLDSAPGEPIGGGEFHFYIPADGTFEGPAYSPSTTESVFLYFHGSGDAWYLNFVAPEGGSLAPGIYDAPWPDYPPTHPTPAGLGVYTNGTACVNTHGWFEVKQIVFDQAGVLTAFWATFEQTCLGAALRGEIRFNADVPIVLDAPAHRVAYEGHPLSFAVGGHDSLGGPVPLSMTGLPPGALFTDSGDGTGRFEWTPAEGQAGSSWMALHGQGAGAGDADIVYTHIQVLTDFDDFDHPIPIPALPFRMTVDSPEAGSAPDDPTCLHPALATVWYSYTPVADGYIQANASPPFGGGPGIAVSIYSGTRGALEQMGCGFHSARAGLVAGQSYHIMISLFAIPTPQFSVSVGSLPPPPPNDNFADATVVTALPFGETIETANISSEPGDPAICGGLTPPFVTSNVWYAYTPVRDTRVTIDTGESDSPYTIGAFTGSRAALAGLGCGVTRFSYTARAGRTDYLMIAPGAAGGIGPGFGGGPGQPSRDLKVKFTGMPPLGIDISIARDGVVDIRGATAVVRGSATCSRPASIVVHGTLMQGRGLVHGEFVATIACTGATTWAAEVTTDAAAGRRARFMVGPAEVQFRAVGVPADNPDDRALEEGREPTQLKATRSR